MTNVELCSCGTYAIGRCSKCSRPVCGDCSRMFGGKRLCTEHAREAAAEARNVDEERRREERAHAEEERRRLEELDDTPLEMSPEDAFDLLFLSEHPTRRQAISAVRILKEVRPEAFVELALSRFQHGGCGTVEWCLNDIGGTSMAMRLARRMRTVQVYWFDKRRTRGLTTAGRLVYDGSAGDWSGGSWSPGSKGYMGRNYLAEHVAQIIDMRAEPLIQMRPPPRQLVD